MRCENCDDPFEARKGTRFCSDACRVAAHRVRVTDEPVTGNVVTRNGGDPVTDNPATAIEAEAKRLYELQVKERGTQSWTFQGKTYRAPGPYVSTPEREARAAKIIALRRKAAHPL